jgi:hypothetical protein
MDPLQRQAARSWRQVQVRRKAALHLHTFSLFQVIPAPLGPPLPPHVTNLRNYAWKPIIMRCCCATRCAPPQRSHQPQTRPAPLRHVFLRGRGPGAPQSRDTSLASHYISCIPRTRTATFGISRSQSLNVGNSRRIGAGFEIDQGVANFRCCLRECQQDFANTRKSHAVSHPDAPLQRDGYFYVTQGEKTLANQTHAGGRPAPLRVPIKFRTHMSLFMSSLLSTLLCRHNEGHGQQRVGDAGQRHVCGRHSGMPIFAASATFFVDQLMNSI